MTQNPSKSSMNGYKAFAFATKISNCPQFVTGGQIGEKYPEFVKNRLQGVKILRNCQYLSKYASSMPQNPPKLSMNGYKPNEYATKISNYP